MADLKVVISQKLVDAVNTGAKVETHTIASANSWDHQEVVGAAKSLSSREVVLLEQIEVKVIALTNTGREIIQLGSAEFRLWTILTQPMTQPAAEAAMKANQETFKYGMSQAMRLKWVKLNKTDAGQLLERAKDSVSDDSVGPLKLIQENKSSEVPANVIADLQKRKLITTTVLKPCVLTKGPKFSVDNWNVQLVTDINSAMLESGAWKTAVFKPLNLNSLGVPPESGHLHPLLKVRAEFRNIFLELGFEEMPTNNYIESSFWNFDSLFQPQSHPARDAHDTFFISDPANALQIPAEYMKKVKKMHEVGGHGSYGYHYNWKETEARKNILRTHTTAVSSRMLYKLAQQKEFTPKKYFSIDRVFRNESLDATHLAEFHQVEGLVADRNLTLPDLIGCISQFFAKWGITDIKFKPAYNPYTEPSMEIFAYHPQLKKLVEIGNSGIFRPEMLLPMGLPPDVRVIAWGLSLERPTMIKYKLPNIRALEGNKVDFEFVQTNPICRLGE